MFSVKYFIRLYRSDTLVGIARVETPAGLIFHNVAIHNRNGFWYALPGKCPKLNEAGQHIRDDDHGLQWRPVITFSSDLIRDRFSNAVISALKRTICRSNSIFQSVVWFILVYLR